LQRLDRPAGSHGPPPTPEVVVATPTPLSEADLSVLDIEEALINNLYQRVGPSVAHITAASSR